MLLRQMPLQGTSVVISGLLSGSFMCGSHVACEILLQIDDRLPPGRRAPPGGGGIRSTG